MLILVHSTKSRNGSGGGDREEEKQLEGVFLSLRRRSDMIWISSNTRATGITGYIPVNSNTDNQVASGYIHSYSYM